MQKKLTRQIDYRSLLKKLSILKNQFLFKFLINFSNDYMICFDASIYCLPLRKSFKKKETFY